LPTQPWENNMHNDEMQSPFWETYGYAIKQKKELFLSNKLFTI
jgi:hypothetical protein